ncbi:tumor necrosis factor receptor superfamily member 6B-like [Scleropages formosus]|nr:tumor necrosis factor receptor superfamily member 6B-like [Scleropages formosus]
MLLPLLPLILFIIGSTEPTPTSTITYQYDDPATGLVLTCDRCPPGSYMLAHCSARTRTVCAPCPPGHFTQRWNYLSRCLYCSVACGENQVVKEECSPLRNTVCECRRGYYMYYDLCRRHSECSPGHGVALRGSAYQNTVCEKCPRGTYSPGGSSGAACASHTDCASRGLVLLLKGTDWHDNLCATCQELQAGGGLQLLRGILPDFFGRQKINKNKLVRFVKKSLLRRHHGASVPRDPLAHIGEWCKNADETELRKLPAMLRRSNLHHIAEKLEKKLNIVTNVSPCDPESAVKSESRTVLGPSTE